MENIDKITLELLMNKNSYNRYVEQTDPDAYEKHQKFRNKVHKYKSKILSCTENYLDDENYSLTTEMDTMMNDFIRCFVKHFEIKELESEEREPEDDVLFDNIQQGELSEIDVEKEKTKKKIASYMTPIKK